MMKLYGTVLATALVMASPVLAQDKAADNMQILLEKVKADKKLLVAGNMKLTEEEAKGFWPIYDDYQKELQQLGGRFADTLKAYADAYNKGSVSNETAKQLLEGALAIDESELQLKRTYVPKFAKVVPMSKVTRYFQIERKIRAAVNYDMARRIPLVEESVRANATGT